MNGPWFVETLARNGDVLHRHRIGALPIRLGRGYDNDVIVDDDHAAPRHAIVESGPQGELVMRDLGTRNGIVHRGRRVDTIALTGDTVVRMGHTSLRVRAADYRVPDELVDRTMHGWEGAVPGLAGLLLTAAVALFTMWLADAQAFQPLRYLLALAYGVGAALAWSGLWALGNRLFTGHAQLGRHLFIFGCGLVALTVYKIASSAIAYAWSLEALTRFGALVSAALVAGMVYFHLATVKPRLRGRLRAVSAALALLGAGLVLVANEQRHGRLADELYMSVLMPPELRASPDHSVDEFMANVGAMQQVLDLERTRKPPDEGEY